MNIEKIKDEYMKRINRASYNGDEYLAAKLMAELIEIIKESE